MLWQATAADTAAMVALIDRVTESTGLMLIYLATVLFAVGWIVLAAGLYLTRAFPAWIPALLGIGMVAMFVGNAAFTKWLTVAGSIAFILGAAPIGWRMLTQSDEEWEAGAQAVPEMKPVAT